VKHPGLLVAANAMFAAMFVVAAGLQYNDPDPAVWIALYAGAAAATMAALHVRGGWVAAAVVAAIAAAWGAWLWYGVAGSVEATDIYRKMSEKGGKVEEMREAGGLSIGAVWLAVSARAGWRASRHR
jgi:hypothetical protein